MRIEAAYVAAVAAFQLAEDCKNVAKISFVTGTFGMGTICVFAPGPSNVVILDKYEVNGEVVIKTKVGLPIRRIINWTSVELSTPRTMYEWEGHGIWEACQVMELSMADFSVI